MPYSGLPETNPVPPAPHRHRLVARVIEELPFDEAHVEEIGPGLAVHVHELGGDEVLEAAAGGDAGEAAHRVRGVFFELRRRVTVFEALGAHARGQALLDGLRHLRQLRERHARRERLQRREVLDEEDLRVREQLPRATRRAGHHRQPFDHARQSAFGMKSD